MAELTPKEPSPDGIFGIKAGSKLCKSEHADGSAGNSPLNPSPLVYVRYKDHVIYKNIQAPQLTAVERETVGWISHQNQEIIHIEHDRTVQDKISGQGNGIIVLKCCIVEMLYLPLQKNSKWLLNSPSAKDSSEYALQPKKRKTHPTKEQTFRCRH
jgi:hypothetical protein